MRKPARLACCLCLGLVILSCAQSDPPDVLELSVKSVLFLRPTDSPVVILTDKEEKRFLPIWIGPAEAQAIAMELHQIKPPRPMTHDLIGALLRELGATVEKLTITETRANTYFAALSVSSRGKTRTIDCRPSDGIAIALRLKAPIFAAESVLRNALPLPAEGAAEQAGVQRFETLGLTLQTLTPDLAQAMGLTGHNGLLVSDSQQKTVQTGDLVLAVGDTAIRSLETFAQAVEKAGRREIVLKILRGERTITAQIQPRDP